MARDHDPQVVDLVYAILNRERVVYEAIVMLACTVGAISRVTDLTTAQRIELAELLRDIGDEVERRREPVKV